MALLYVAIPNQYYPLGTYLETGDDGFVERVEMHYENGRMRRGRLVGIGIPEHLVRQFTITVLRRGFDDMGAHREIRRAGY